MTYNEIRELLPKRYPGFEWEFPSHDKPIPGVELGSYFFAIGRAAGLRLTVQGHWMTKGFHASMGYSGKGDEASNTVFCCDYTREDLTIEEVLKITDKALAELHAATTVKGVPTKPPDTPIPPPHAYY